MTTGRYFFQTQLIYLRLIYFSLDITRTVTESNELLRPNSLSQSYDLLFIIPMLLKLVYSIRLKKKIRGPRSDY